VLELHLPSGIDLHPLVGKRWPAETPAQLLQLMVGVSRAAYGGVQAETGDVRAQRLLEVLLPGQDALQR
jgi:hypothetical protein